MTIKSATPSGSQRERACASERPWFKADIDDWGIVRDRLPRPWPARLCALDLRYMEARERYCKVARDGQTVLQARWGLSATAVKKHLRAFAALTEDAAVPMGCPEGAHGVPMGCPSEPHQDAILADEVPMGCPEGAHGVPMGCPEPVENAQQVALLEAPKRESETESETENTSKPAKAGGGAEEACADLLTAMHAIALEHDPRARLQRVTTHEKRIARTLKGVAKDAKAARKTPAELILDGWRWWWANPNDFLRVRYPGAEAYPIVLQAEKVLKYAAAWAEVEAARYVPTADEALDAVLEVGCAEAEARYPAAARAIRQTFDFDMGGNLARMRAPKDPDRMRAAWATGYGKYLTPKLSLVAR